MEQPKITPTTQLTPKQLKASVAIKFEPLYKKIKDQIKSAVDLPEVETSIYELFETFQKCLKKAPIELMIVEYRKIVAFIEKYDFQTIHTVRAFHGLHPISNINVKMIDTMRAGLVECSRLLLDRLAVDERFVSLEDMDRTLYHRILTLGDEIKQVIVRSTLQEIKVNLLYIYNDLSKANKETLISLFDQYQLVLMYVSKRLNILYEINNLTPTMHYELHKVGASIHFIHATFAPFDEHREESRKEIEVFLTQHTLEIKRDPLMNPLFCFPEITAYFDALFLKKPSQSNKKKKSKKKTSSIEDVTNNENEASTVNIPDESDEPHENTNPIVIEPSPTNSADENVAVEVCGLKAADEDSGCIYDQLDIKCFTDEEVRSVSKQYINAYANLKQESDAWMRSQTQPLFEQTPPSIFVAAIEKGFQLVQMLDTEAKRLEALRSAGSPLFCSLFFTPECFVQNKASTPMYFIQCKNALVEVLAHKIEIFAKNHIYLAKLILDLPEYSALNDVILLEHLDIATSYNSRIKPEIDNQSSPMALRYTMDKLFYVTDQLKAQLALRQNKSQEIEINERTTSFITNYKYQIAKDPHFIKAPDLATALASLEVNKTKKTPQQTSLEKEQEKLKNILKTHWDRPDFEETYNKQLKKIKHALTACFDYHALEFSHAQLQNMVIFARQFSYYSLSKFFNYKTSLINEKSTFFICRLYEVLIQTGSDFMKTIPALMKRNVYVNEFYEVITLTLLYVGRTYLFLAQELTSENEGITPQNMRTVKLCLGNVNMLTEEYVTQFGNIDNLESRYGYALYGLVVINTLVRSKIERFCDNEAGALFLENRHEKQVAKRKKHYPDQAKLDRYLPPSYGHQELKFFLDWVQINANAQAAASLEKTPNPLTDKPKKNKRKKTGLKPGSVDMSSSEAPPQAPTIDTQEPEVLPNEPSENTEPDRIESQEQVVESPDIGQPTSADTAIKLKENSHSRESRNDKILDLMAVPPSESTSTEFVDIAAVSSEQPQVSSQSVDLPQVLTEQPAITVESLPAKPKRNRRKKSETKVAQSSSIEPAAINSLSCEPPDTTTAPLDVNHAELDTAQPLMNSDSPLGEPPPLIFMADSLIQTDIVPVDKSHPTSPWDVWLSSSERVPLFFESNPTLRGIFEGLTSILNECFPQTDVYLYGSSHFKRNPADFDLCILHATRPDVQRCIEKFIERLKQFCAKVPPKNEQTNEYGYREDGRHTIYFVWSQIKIEITLSPCQHYLEFIRNLDYTVCAMGYHVKHQKVMQRRDCNGFDDIDRRILNTIHDPMEVFSADPSRILRGVRLIVTENFVFSEACFHAIRALFWGNKNLFDEEHISLKVLIRHVKRLFHQELTGKKASFHHTRVTLADEAKAMGELYRLGLIPKLLMRFHAALKSGFNSPTPSNASPSSVEEPSRGSQEKELIQSLIDKMSTFYKTIHRAPIQYYSHPASHHNQTFFQHAPQASTRFVGHRKQRFTPIENVHKPFK